MTNAVDSLLTKFRREHPFTYMSPEVVALVQEVYEAGKNAATISAWTKEEA